MFQRRLIKERNVRKKKRKRARFVVSKITGQSRAYRNTRLLLSGRKEDGQIEREREEEEGIALFFERDRTGVVIV